MGVIKGLRAVVAVLAAVALGLSLWLAAQRQVFHQEELAVAGVTLRPVTEETMAPALVPGDLAVAAQRPAYQLGDPVLCAGGGFSRLVGSTEGGFIVRGDSQGEEAEALLPPGEIRGKVVAALPGAGAVWGFLSSWWGPVAILAAGGALVALPSLLLGRGESPRGRHAR